MEDGVCGVLVVELAEDAHAVVEDALGVIRVQNVVGFLYLCVQGGCLFRPGTMERKTFDVVIDKVTNEVVNKYWFIQSTTPNLWLHGNDWQTEILQALSEPGVHVGRKINFSKGPSGKKECRYNGYFVKVAEGEIAMYDEFWERNSSGTGHTRTEDRVKRKCEWNKLPSHPGAESVLEKDLLNPTVYKRSPQSSIEGFMTEHLESFHIKPIENAGYMFIQSMRPNQWLHAWAWEQDKMHELIAETEALHAPMNKKYVKYGEYECNMVYAKTPDGSTNILFFDKLYKNYGNDFIQNTGKWVEREVLLIPMNQHDGALRLVGTGQYDDVDTGEEEREVQALITKKEELLSKMQPVWLKQLEGLKGAELKKLQAKHKLHRQEIKDRYDERIKRLRKEWEERRWNHQDETDHSQHSTDPADNSGGGDSSGTEVAYVFM